MFSVLATPERSSLPVSPKESSRGDREPHRAADRRAADRQGVRDAGSGGAGRGRVRGPAALRRGG